MGLHTPEAGLTDFFECMSVLSKFNAALAQGFVELEKETLPENGFAVSCLELCMYRKAMILLKKQTQVIADGVDPEDLKGQSHFEEDFYFGCSDKLIQVMKELHIEIHPDNLYTRSNPLVTSKLDVQVSSLLSLSIIVSAKLQLPADKIEGGCRFTPC